MNYALLLSGGIGSRVGSEIPKQYIQVNGHLMATYALAPLLQSPRVDAVVLVAGEGWRESLLADARAADLDAGKILGYAIPGRNRQESIWNGMREILRVTGERGGLGEGAGVVPCSEDFVGALPEASTVLIHDAARPLLKTELLDACYEALAGNDGVMPVLPMKDTVYRSADGARVSELLNRSEIYAGQAPELFRFASYYRAVERLLPERILTINGATEPAVLAGLDIAMVSGDEGNFKVTTSADLERFRQILEDSGEQR